MQSLLQEPIQRAKCSLEGLSVGDAFGETFFINPDVVEGLIEQRALATRTWNYTDDTQMALSIYSRLRQYGHIHQQAKKFDYPRQGSNLRPLAPEASALIH